MKVRVPDWCAPGSRLSCPDSRPSPVGKLSLGFRDAGLGPKTTLRLRIIENWTQGTQDPHLAAPDLPPAGPELPGSSGWA
jgi:hypothetical protein